MVLETPYGQILVWYEDYIIEDRKYSANSGPINSNNSNSLMTHYVITLL